MKPLVLIMAALSAIAQVDATLARDAKPAVDVPARASFEDFLLNDAKVPDLVNAGDYAPYSFEGREAVRVLVRRIDHVLGTKTGEAIPDASVSIAGGAQWGKTILELNLAAYCTSQRFLRFGMFLPDDSLAAGMVDTKLRPDVIDQIPWLAEMTQLGKAINKSGKAVNRKGAFTINDGKRKSYGLVLGLQKIPTSYTLDIAAQDEVDDIPEKTGRFVRGRLTASPLRFSLSIGTQRVAGRGMNKAWKDGSQGVILLGPVGDSAWNDRDENGEIAFVPEAWINPEEAFPGIVRRQLGDSPSNDDPQLTWTGEFKREGIEEQTWAYTRTGDYYLAHPATGAVLDRARPLAYHRQPKKLESENWSLRISQLSIGAISVSQIAYGFCDDVKGAVASQEAMIVFRCDVLALPQSSAQKISPEIIQRAQRIEPFAIRLTREQNRPVFGGMDVGDQCWFVARERESGSRKRMTFVSRIPAADMVRRAVSLFHTIGLTSLFIDQRPLVNESRSIALALNELDSLSTWPESPAMGNHDAFITLPGGLTWNGRLQRWQNLRCAVVRFDVKRLGGGIQHGFDRFEEQGVTKWVPLINCNRFETIDRVVREFLTPAEGNTEVVDGRIRELPAMLLPRTDCDTIVPTLEAHLLTGSERAKEKDGALGDYVDQCANHLLLSDGYSALAEIETAGQRNTHGSNGKFKAVKRGGKKREVEV